MRLLAVSLLVGSRILACGSRPDLMEGPVGAVDAGPARDGATSQPSAAVDASVGYPGIAAADELGAARVHDPSVCHAGCLCSPANDCPSGCYVTEIERPDGSASAPFCGNGIAMCGAGWSIGTPVDNCGSGQPRYLDAGPDGAFCCER